MYSICKLPSRVLFDHKRVYVGVGRVGRDTLRPVDRYKFTANQVGHLLYLLVVYSEGVNGFWAPLTARSRV
jgi:hypothetical protein